MEMYHEASASENENVFAPFLAFSTFTSFVATRRWTGRSFRIWIWGMVERALFTIFAFAMGPKYFTGAFRHTLWILQPSRSGRSYRLFSLPGFVSAAILPDSFLVAESREHRPKVIVTFSITLVLMHI